MKQEQNAEQNDPYKTPAFMRNQNNYDALKERDIDYDMPAFMRMSSDMF